MVHKPQNWEPWILSLELAAQLAFGPATSSQPPLPVTVLLPQVLDSHRSQSWLPVRITRELFSNVLARTLMIVWFNSCRLGPDISSFLQLGLLRCNLHTVEFTFLCTVLWVLIYTHTVMQPTPQSKHWVFVSPPNLTVLLSENLSPQPPDPGGYSFVFCGTDII